MKKLSFDSGIREYQINNNGVLRFNPADPNVYARFLEAGKKIEDVETALVARAKDLPENATEVENGTIVLQIMADADKQVKEILAWVFGAENDFDKILGGVNLLAVGANGERVITNFLNALLPIMQEGAENCARQQVGSAVAQANLNRAQRRAAAKK